MYFLVLKNGSAYALCGSKSVDGTNIDGQVKRCLVSPGLCEFI